MPTLLVSLGIAPAIVPEAFLLPGVDFGAVHVLTTDSDRVDTGFIEQWFAERAPEVWLTLTRVTGFTDFTSEEDHFRFEEVLYRWWLARADPGYPPFVCLSGGFKTMSAAMQKAAAVFGAAEVFHVLCDLPLPEQPKTAEEIESALEKGHLHHIRLGPEGGWPQLSNLMKDDYPLIQDSATGAERFVHAPDYSFREHLRAIVERSHNIAGAWDRISDLPFPVLATWSAPDLAWLREPVDPDKDRDWIASLPKIDLHCHLGGFATHGALLDEVRAAASPDFLPPCVEPPLPAGWPRPGQPVPLADYMALGDANGSALLKDPDCLRRQIELLHNHFLEQNIVHAEVRCSPGNYASPGRSPWTVLEEIKQTFDRCMLERPGCRVNLLVIGTRRKEGDYRTAILRHLMLAITAAEHWPDDPACRVVGVDLAGFEDRETRAHYYREDFRIVHRAGLALTVHAGENDDSEGVWSAVFDLSTRRIGHALSLGESPELLRSVANRRIGVEMCPFANFQIKGFRPMPGKPIYPLKRYLDAGVPVTVNTDNIGISAASLTDNILLAARMCPDLTRLDVLRLLHGAFETAFLSPVERKTLHQTIESRLSPP